MTTLASELNGSDIFEEDGKMEIILKAQCEKEACPSGIGKWCISCEFFELEKVFSPKEK